MKTYKQKYYKKRRTFKNRGGSGPRAGAAAHSGERFKCPLCDKTYAAMSCIYTHAEKQHPGQRLSLTHASTVVRGADAVDPRASSERFKCPFCDTTYTSITNIYGHCRKKHPGIPMVRLTYDNTVVRPAHAAPDAAASVPASVPAFVPASVPASVPAIVERMGASSASISRVPLVSRDRQRVDSEDSDYNDDSLPGDPRFKCPYCDKTYSEMLKILGHCYRRHRSQPWPVLTYENTIVRPAVAADAAPVSHRASVSQARAALESHSSSVEAAAAAAAADALSVASAVPVRVGEIVSRTGTLKGNRDYIPNPGMIPQFPISDSKLQRNSTYMDWEDLEEKNVLDALNSSPATLAFKINGSFCVITKDELFNLMMNNPDSIKYECSRICDFSTDGHVGISQSAMKGVPYLSLGSFSQIQGLVSFFDLWYIVSHQDISQSYELVEATRPQMKSIASHNFLFGKGSAGQRAVSAAHCQAGQDASTVYEIHILPVQTHSRSRAATTIQRLVRGHRSRKTHRNGH